jgi:Tol biopolymer transport system component
MGVYSLREMAWKFYGDFCSVGSAAFSPDGRRVAFMGKARSGNPDCGYVYDSDLLQILDLETGGITPVPETGATMDNAQLSWAPDSKRLAMGLKNQIVLIEIWSWAQKAIAEGSDPSWSPKGTWIAYFVHDRQTCMIIHPDGTGAQSALDLRRRSGGWLFYAGIVWSPDEEKLLLNEEVIDGVDYHITMLDVATGKVTRESNKGEAVFGWIPKSGNWPVLLRVIPELIFRNSFSACRGQYGQHPEFRVPSA